METQEALDKTAIAISLLEWEHDIGIAAALEIDMKRVKDWERLKAEIASYKRGVIASTEVGKGIIMGLSYIEGCIAEMENEDDR